MILTDTHTHLYQPAFKADCKQVIERACEQGVERMYLPAIDSETHGSMLDLEEKYPELCPAMMGLHPCSVKEDFIKELKGVERWLSKRKWCGIGETGLDFYWDKTFVKQQIEAFEKQIHWAIELDIPLIIHTRNATQETIDIIHKYQTKKLRGIFHCFSGNASQAKQAVDAGFLLGIGGVLTYKNSDLPASINDIDLQYLVLETDSPYLTPIPHRGKRNESAYITFVAEKLAELKKMTTSEVAKQTTLNARKLFSSGNN